jgi:hypothetical protein
MKQWSGGALYAGRVFNFIWSWYCSPICVAVPKDSAYLHNNSNNNNKTSQLVILDQEETTFSWKRDYGSIIRE